jgi:hypothetical protein
MEKEFVPYQEALELKELGFDYQCVNYYSHYGNGQVHLNNLVLCSKIGVETNNDKGILAPLYQQAFRWFREKYDISYSIDWMSRSLEFYNGYYVHFRGINDNKINQENFIVLNDELPSKGYKVYKTYEEAELECLKKLIEIVKEK